MFKALMRRSFGWRKARCQGRGDRHFVRLEPLENRVLLSVNFVADLIPSTPINRPDVALGNFNNFEEPNIAVNHRIDPGNIAITSHNDVIVSSDFFANTNTNTYPAANFGDTWADFDSQGRLFWTNLDAGTGGVGVTQVNPTTAVPGANVVVQTPPGSQSDDRQALAADSNPNSPFADNIYTIWTRFGVPAPSTGTEVFIGSSSDQGANWNVVQVGDSNGPDNTPLNGDDEGFGQQVTIHVAPNGDVYGSYHIQPSFDTTNTFEPDGTTGDVIVVRSTDGGATFSQKTTVFGAGGADIPFNRQEDPANFANTQFLTQGSVQPVVLADQARSGQVYVLAVDDPDNTHGNGDDADLVFARSTDNGNSWTTQTLFTGAGSYQLFPTANVDQFGNMVIGWYDTFRGQTNAGGNFLLDFFAMYSTDGGQTFSNPFMVNDPANPFDPDETPTTPFKGGPTTRIGEYFGMDLFGGTGYVVWNGNTPGDNTTSQQLYFDAFAIDGTLYLTGDDAGATNDDIVIRNIGTNTDFVEVIVNGQRQYAGLREGLSGGIFVNSLDGNDTLTIDFTNGNPIPVGGLDYDGGNGVDTLVISNGPDATYTPDATNNPAQGSLSVGGSTITFSEIEFVRPVDPVLGTVFLNKSVIDENDAVTLTGSFIDPGSLSSHILTVDWGDGSSNTVMNLSAGDRSFAVAHTYLDDNPTDTSSDINTVTVTITDDDNLFDSDNSLTIMVNNLDPVITSFASDATFADKGKEGEPVTITGAFTDVGTLDTHTAVVDWGDGTAVETVTVIQGAGFGTVTGSHAYAAGGIYTITVTLTDDDTGTDQAMTTAVVTGVGLNNGVLYIIGSSEDDDVSVNQTGKGDIKVHSNFTPESFRTFAVADVDKIISYLCEGDDHLTISNRTKVPAVIHGGADNDHLHAGGGVSVLLGDSGDDKLVGQGGRNILIGGTGPDQLVGGRDEDVLIGGSTNSDEDDSALLAAALAWSANQAYNSRVAAIIASLAGVDDNEIDILTGSAGQDLYYAGLDDVFKGLKSNETVN